MIPNSLKDKLQRFNPKRPYVWELKITEDEFRSLEADLCSYTPDVSQKDDALKILVYVAEWYKRRYTNRAKKDYQKTFGGKKPDLKKVWETLDIDKRFVYEGANGQRLYLYSTFVLGGLAIKFEQQRNEKPFLRSLCVILNGEEDSFDNLKDGGHAIAFSESVRQEHSMKYYLKAIVKHHDDPDYLPFAREDYDNADTSIKELIKLIKEINDAVQKSKFRLEWVFNAPYGDNMITRTLHLWLNPYKGDGEKRHLYGYNDIHDKWGVHTPGEQHYIRIGVRFLLQKGNTEPVIVQDADPNHPAISFRNTGNESVGFIASEQDYAIVNRVPVTEFNKVSIVCWDDEGNEYPIATEDVNLEAAQLYRMEKFEDYWTTRALPKRETVVIFNAPYSISEESDDKEFEIKTLYNRRYGEGMKLNWCPVRIAVVLQDAKGKLLDPFVNKQGESRVLFHLYEDTIQYSPNGMLIWRHKEDETEEETTNFVSLVTKKEDVLVYFKDNNEEGEEKAGEIIVADLVQFRASNGQYVDWEEEREPAYGINYIRVYARHKQINKNERLSIFYLPGGITRNCEEHTISYRGENAQVKIDDEEDLEICLSQKRLLAPTTTVIIMKGETDCVEIPVYRPTKLKEICIDEELLRSEETDSICIPYILKNNIIVNLFGEFGYETYDCSKLGSIYPFWGDLSNAHLSAWEHAKERKATQLDPYAPDCLSVKFGDRFDERRHRRLEFYYWNYSTETEPQKVRYGTNQEKNTIIFQSLNKVNAQLVNVYPTIVNSPFGKKVKADCLKCFEVATFHRLHYFAMKPLLALENDKKLYVMEIYEPLLSKRNGKLTVEDVNGLKRLADEFQFDWQDYNIDINIL